MNQMGLVYMVDNNKNNNNRNNSRSHLCSTLRVSGAILNPLCVSSLFSPPNNLIKIYCSGPHFIDNKAKTQRGEVPSTVSHSGVSLSQG